MESYSYMCHPGLVLTALRTSSNKTTPGLRQRKSFPTANRLIQYHVHCLLAWFGPSNFGVVYIEAQICRGLNHIKRRFTNFATFDLSAMRGTEKCVTPWVLAKGVRSEDKESTYPSCSTSRGHKEGPNNNNNNKYSIVNILYVKLNIHINIIITILLRKIWGYLRLRGVNLIGHELWIFVATA